MERDIKLIKISELKVNEDNPRYINDAKFTLLKRSIENFPEMLTLRPIIVNHENVVLGGNMRLRAAADLGLTEIPVIQAGDLTPKQQREFIIKDNVSFGKWDWDLITNEWSEKELSEWGMSGPAAFDPNLSPATDYSDVSDDDMNKAKQSMDANIAKSEKIEVICPSCGEEFNINNPK